MLKQNLIFNLDDTLIECNKYFNQVNERFAAAMGEWFPGVAPDKVKAKQVELDVAAIGNNGLTVDHLSQSFTGAYRFFCAAVGKMPEKAHIGLLTELGYSVFTIPVEPLPHMYETLERLKEAGHELYLHTGGEEGNQRRKVAQLELAAYFGNRVFISRHKDVKALEKIMREMRFDPSVTWMIGNSLRTDILPGLEQGIHVIYIPAQSEWHYNMVDIHVQPKGAFLTLTGLDQIAGAIEKYVLEHMEEDLDGMRLPPDAGASGNDSSDRLAPGTPANSVF
ncbi:MAG: Haloacid dehalogenase-like hydrolase [Paenibacillaceae bacterium]|jgi:putative hydrolase of the HAD superfamily|nr:Haloacid dehalogenase-like hydrolase [Paenibacillaceae bacterium]